MPVRRFYRFCIVAVIVIIGIFVTHQILLSSYVSLSKAPALSGQVVQASQAAGKSAKLLVAGKDFSLDTVRYFDNGNWVFVHYKALNNNINSGYAILQKRDGIFQVVAGPSSTLEDDYTYSIPLDMTTYLVQQGIID